MHTKNKKGNLVHELLKFFKQACVKLMIDLFELDNKKE